jgi:hypothetical protein
MRYPYVQQITPPAPFVHVFLSKPNEPPALINIPAQVDPGAAKSVLPTRYAEELGLMELDKVEVAGFGFIKENVPTFLVQLGLRELPPMVLEVLAHDGEPYVLLGRDVLNRYRIVLDGPNLTLEIG